MNIPSTKYNPLERFQSAISFKKREMNGFKAHVLTIATMAIGARSAYCSEEIERSLTRGDVGFVDLNFTEPKVTDICWMDIKVAESAPVRVEFSLYGDIVPRTVMNFKNLCSNELTYGYRGSDIFRIISSFSIQGGNILPEQQENVIAPSARGQYGRAADDRPFPQENFRILHSFRDAGVLSMMKDIRNKNLQDSRFFVTLEPAASWADDKVIIVFMS
jgi:cyclophilin family peptidyl-prolyl cis-trans isomerase